jgi:multidrug resistance efflux pump
LEENRSFKKKIIKGVGVFLGVILMFTILSKTVYTILLPQVTMDTVKSGMIETKFLTNGKIGQDTLTIKGRKVQVKAPSDGTITECFVEEYQPVKKGDRLFKIKGDSDQDKKIQQELDQAALEIQKTSIERKRADLLEEKAAAQKKLSAKKTEIEKNTKSYSLINLEGQIKHEEKLAVLNEDLYALGTLSKSEYEKAREDLNLLKKQKEELEKSTLEQKDTSLENLKNNVKVIESQLAALDEEAELANKKLEAKIQLNQEVIVTSPIDGIVYEIDAAIGASALSHEQLGVVIPKDIPITLSFEVTSKQADKMKVGQEISWSVDNQKEAATIIKKSYDETNPNVTVTNQIAPEIIEALEVDYKNYKEVSVEVISTTQKYDLLVSNSAIITEGVNKYVYSIEKNEGPFETTYSVHKNEVTVVKAGDYMSAITGSLEKKDDIIKNTSKPLREGIEVAIN